MSYNCLEVRPIGRENHNTKRSARRGAVGGEGGAQRLDAGTLSRKGHQRTRHKRKHGPKQATAEFSQVLDGLVRAAVSRVS
eukprot:5818822-Prymnesium_polylepis.1